MKKLIPIFLIASLFVASSVQSKAQGFTAQQYFQKDSIVLNGNIEKVFPLFTALGEKKWAEEWNPKFISPISGHMEEGLIFKTSDHVAAAPPLTWVVGKYDLDRHQIRYIISSPIRVVIISVSCSASSEDGTKAVISYKLTGLTEDGNELSRHLIETIFADHLKDWETAINGYLKKLK